MSVSSLPALNAGLNASSAVLLATGYACIRSGKVNAHRACMVTALLLSSVFLASYLFYHWHVGHVRFTGPAGVRVLYLGILISHTVLAVVNVPIILRTLYLATQSRFEEHRRAARWAFPSWMYVSVTGVIVYWMLYRLYPAGV